MGGDDFSVVAASEPTTGGGVRQVTGVREEYALKSLGLTRSRVGAGQGAGPRSVAVEGVR